MSSDAKAMKGGAVLSKGEGKRSGARPWHGHELECCVKARQGRVVQSRGMATHGTERQRQSRAPQCMAKALQIDAVRWRSQAALCNGKAYRRGAMAMLRIAECREAKAGIAVSRTEMQWHGNTQYSGAWQRQREAKFRKAKA